MPAFIDLTGVRFGRWTVLHKDPEMTKIKGRIYWICQCDCGTIRSVCGELLRNGHSKSCGCYKSDVIHDMCFKDLTGQIFGRYKVKEWQKEKSLKAKETYYLCECECGTIKSVRAADLVTGKTLSCGCLQREQASKCNSKHNEIIIHEELGYADVYFFNSDDSFKCDIRDLDIARKYCWHKSPYGYAVSSTRDEDGNNHILFFHRLVLAKYYDEETLKNNDVTDHILHNRLDNRFDYIRPCTQSDNQRNRYRESNTGYRHIHRKKDGKYLCTVTINYEDYTDTVDTIEEALDWVDNFYKEHPELSEYVYKEYLDETKKETYNKIVAPFVDMDGNEIKREVIQPFVFIDQ